MARTSSKFAARMVDAEFQAIKRERGEVEEAFTNPLTEKTEQNRVLISVRALNDLSRALRGEDTLRAMKRNTNNWKGGA